MIIFMSHKLKPRLGEVYNFVVVKQRSPDRYLTIGYTKFVSSKKLDSVLTHGNQVKEMVIFG